MAAAQKGSAAMVSLLLSSGADPTLLAKGRTALDVALGPEVEALDAALALSPASQQRFGDGRPARS